MTTHVKPYMDLNKKYPLFFLLALQSLAAKYFVP